MIVHRRRPGRRGRRRPRWRNADWPWRSSSTSSSAANAPTTRACRPRRCCARRRRCTRRDACPGGSGGCRDARRRRRAARGAMRSSTSSDDASSFRGSKSGASCSCAGRARSAGERGRSRSADGTGCRRVARSCSRRALVRCCRRSPVSPRHGRGRTARSRRRLTVPRALLDPRRRCRRCRDGAGLCDAGLARDARRARTRADRRGGGVRVRAGAARGCASGGGERHLGAGSGDRAPRWGGRGLVALELRDGRTVEATGAPRRRRAPSPHDSIGLETRRAGAGQAGRRR